MRLFPIILFLGITVLYSQDKTVLISYYSSGGHTKQLANAVAEGAQSIDEIIVVLKQIDNVTKEELISADAIIVGSPVYNANVAPQVQQFINSWPFKNAPLKDKIGAAFTTGGGISAGEELVQLNILHSMLIFGMIVVGGPEWEMAFGASAITAEKPFDDPSGIVDEPFLDKGRKLGRRVAELVNKIKD